MASKTWKIRVYGDGDDWRWVLVAPNGTIVADSKEAFRSKRNAVRSASKVAEQFTVPPVLEGAS